MNCKFLIAFGGIVLLIGLATDAFAASTFFDVAGTDYEAAYTYLSEQNVVQGYSNGSGKPDAPLNRVEALKVILASEGGADARIAWYVKNMPPLPLFTDADQSAWYGPYVEVAFEEGIITGYRDGTLRPGQSLRTEEAIAMLMRAFGEEGNGSRTELSDFIENRQGEWFTPHINRAINRNLVMHKGKLKLGKPITRGQFFDMVHRLSKIRESGEATYAGAEPQIVSNEPTFVATRPQPQNLPPTGVSQQQVGTSQVSPQHTLNVITSSTIDHPHASEKYFAVTIPTLGITDLPIIHPTDALSKEGVLAPLKDGVGHLFSYPGGGGKIMVYGHSSGYPWDVSQYTKIFRRVNELHPGDKIYVTYSGNLYIYEVTFEQTIAAKDTTPFNDSGSGEELILYTCWPADSISQRYLVHAVPVEVIAAK